MKKSNYIMLITCIAAMFVNAAYAQTAFTNSNAKLATPSFHSGCPVTIVDWNGDGLDDIVRLNSGRYCYVEVQRTNQQFQTISLGDFGGGAWAMTVADVDHNGYKDVLADGSGGIGLLKTNNNGTGATMSWLPNSGFFLQNATFGDFNNDGWVDIFGCDDNAPSHIYLNNGAGNFTESSMINFALPNGSDNSGNYGSVWTDFDNDGDLDLYIAKCRQGVNSPSDYRRIDVLFVNDGNNNYTEMAATYGVANGWQTWTASFGDIDNDGDLDLLATNHDHESQIFTNDGTGHYTDVTASTGFDITDITPIESVMEDFDNDGFNDLLITGSDSRFYHNNGNGTFTKIDNLFDGNNMESFAVGDLNHDGFPDVYASYATIYTNPSNINDVVWLNNRNSNHFITFDLRGTISNHGAIGAKAIIYGAWGRQVREVRAGESYGTANSAMLHFGLGSATVVDSVVIHWPSGIDQTIVNPAVDEFVKVTENECVSPSSVVTFNGSLIVCPGQSLTLTAPAGTGYTYLWSDGSSLQTLDVTQTGEYNVQITAPGNNCVAYSSTLNIQESPDQTPTIAAVGNVEFCNGGSVQLTGPANELSYLWSNGETTQNITVTQSGNYVLTIQGVCQPWSSNAIAVTAHNPAAPTAADVTLTAPGSATLTATTGTGVSWYDVNTGGTPLATGNVFNTPVVSNTTVFYAESSESFGGGTEDIGIMNNPATYSGNTTNALMYFDVLQNCMLQSVTVYTDLAGTRKIELRDAGNNLVNSLTVNVATGAQVIALNFALTPGTQYSLGTDEATNQTSFGYASPRFQRNNTGVAYPYTSAGFASITGNNFGSQYYYYFYDWKIEKPLNVCTSIRVPVTVFVTPTGITETTKNGIHVFPNPANDKITIRLDNAATTTIKIFDQTGRLLKNEMINAAENSIDIATLAAGVYQLRLQKDNSQFMYKLIVQ